MDEKVKEQDNLYELKQVNVRIRLSEAQSLYSTEPMNTPDGAIQVMAEALSEMDREYCCVINMDNKNRAINFNVVSIGDVNSAVVPIQNAFKAAILSNATSLILLHNHTSGELTPSNEDMLVTNRIIEAGKIMNIPVVDHIIVAGGSGEYYSYREKHPELFDLKVTEAVREAQERNKKHGIEKNTCGKKQSLHEALKASERRVKEKQTEYKPLAKVEELEEENFNQIDNQLSNTAPGDNPTEKKKKNEMKEVLKRGDSSKNSMKKRLLERQKQISYQAQQKDQKTRHKVQEL